MDEGSELDAIRERMKNADMALFDEGETVCCYAKSDKSWVEDPARIAWEAYQTMEDAQLFSQSAAVDSKAESVSLEQSAGGCRASKQKSACC